MRLLTILFLMSVYTLAKKSRLDKILESKRQLEARQKTHQEFEGEYAKQIDQYPEKFRPVPFGHIFKEGFEDPQSGFKQPIDFVELDTIYLRDGPVAKELIEKQLKSYQQIIKMDLPMQFFSPKDAVLHGENLVKDISSENNESYTRFWNMAAIQQKNIFDPPKYRMGEMKPKSVTPDVGPDYNNKAKYFDKETYGLEVDRTGKNLSFTTCDEFGRNARFHPNDIVNIDWVPFYIWTYVRTGRVTIARVHRFEYPTVKLVKKYREEFSVYLNKTVDWEQPKLVFREGSTEFLLIAADRRGLFDAIPYNEIPKSTRNTGMKIPMPMIRLKVVDPYLALMYCEHQYANVMAVVGTEPKTKKEMKSEAATLKLKGKGFPVRRDLDMERHEAAAKRNDELERAKQKYINVEEQLSLSRQRLNFKDRFA